MTPPFSLSTAFFSGSRCSWADMVATTRSLGFPAVELNVEIPALWMEGIVSSVEHGDIAVSSLHNYCPAIADLPPNRTIYSGYLLTADDEGERSTAVAATRATIAWARRTGARAVVLHAGEVPMDPSGRDLFTYALQFGRTGKLYPGYYEAVMTERRRRAPRYIERLMRSLDAILPDAEKAGVVLGLENRFFLHEIPSIEEAARLLERYAGAPVGYWHDTGHAEVFARLGWVGSHRDYLDALAPRIVGMHLHDIRGLDDHRAPGCGDFDFSFLAARVPASAVRVVEAHAKSSIEQMKGCVGYLRKAGLI